MRRAGPGIASSPRWRATLVAAMAVLWVASPGAAQTGFTEAGAERFRELERQALEAIRADSIAAMSGALSARPHVAGTPAQAAVRDTLTAWLERWGLDAEVAAYEVFLPHARSASIAFVAPDTVTFELGEPTLPGDPATEYPQYPWVNGYSAPGVAEGPVVYVNYGLHEDYAALDSIGVDVAGRIVLARYGRSYRGVKARLAEDRGAAALLLYSDPADDGYVRGDVYPEGPFRPWSGVQRGSVMNGVGDPTTPSSPSVVGASRVEPERSPNRLPTIPVTPVSYEVAGRILERVRGADLPDGAWQGGLPTRYHVGPGPGRLRVAVDDDRDGGERGMKPIHDVLARIEGSRWPDELVVVGAHIDAWGAGANDNVSGTTSVWSVARALAKLVGEGWRPRRTIVLAGWDAEEWGLIGSTEWVEEHAAELSEGGVAYLNQDAVGGTRFGAGASHSLAPLVREAAESISVGAGRTLRDDWWEASETRVGDLGGGSDYAAFYNHLGIPSASFGFGTPGGVYHSAYDTWRWMDEFGDPGFVHHAASARLTASLALRLSDAEIVPYDYLAYAGRMARAWLTVRDSARMFAGEATVGEVEAALRALETTGERWNAARDAYLTRDPDPLASRRANAALRSVERAMTRTEGLEGRPWYRNLAFASDRRSGYATIALPSVAEAVRSEDPARVEAEVLDLARRLVEARRRLDAAIESLRR